MRRTGSLFIAVLWTIGLLSGLVVALAPTFLPLPAPHFTLPLIVGLLIEVATRPAVNAGRIEPVTMNERALGVLGAAVISFAVTALLGGGAPVAS